MKTIALYHKDCNDGTTAAAIVLRKYPDACVFPLKHNPEAESLQEVLDAVESGDRVLTVDCVIGVKELLAAGHTVTSIDHHIGVNKEMTEIAAQNKNFTYIFDNNKSGASLTWSTLFPNEPMPEFVKYIEDADLWNWKYGAETKSVNNYVYMLVNKPEEILKLMNSSLDGIKHDGAVLTRQADIMIDHAVGHTDPVMIAIGKHKVALYNIISYRSEIGNKFATLRKEAVGLFSIDGGEVRISFRSLDGQKPSALDLATTLGGGGHEKAAAARMQLTDFIKLIK